MRSLFVIALVATTATAHAGRGNTAKLLTTGERSFAVRRKNIERADVVFYKTYIFANDETGRATVEPSRTRRAKAKKSSSNTTSKARSAPSASW